LVANAASSAAPTPAASKEASKPKSLSVGDGGDGGASPLNPYERFLQPLGTRGPSVDGWVAPTAGAQEEQPAAPSAAASLEAVALLAAQAPPDVEV
jgi:hypothetical protein